MTSWNMSSLFVVWPLLCLCAWTEASYSKTVIINPSYLTINIFQFSKIPSFGILLCSAVDPNDNTTNLLRVDLFV